MMIAAKKKETVQCIGTEGQTREVTAEREHKIKNIAVLSPYIRGEQKKRSDLDLLAEFNGSIGLLDLIGAEQYLTKILKTKVDLIPQNDVRPELKPKILREAVTV